MNDSEILDLIGNSKFSIAVGGYNSDNFDKNCKINNVIIFDGMTHPDEIISHGSNIVRIHHTNITHLNSEKLIYFKNIRIISDEQWELKMFLAKINENSDSLFLTSSKFSLVESQFCLSNAKNSLDENDLFTSCWIKSATMFLIDSILLKNQIIPTPTHSLSSLRNIKQNNLNNFSDQIISEMGLERTTPSLLSRMLKSTSGFSDMIEKNDSSKIIEKKATYLIDNSLLSDCYLFLSYHNRNNFYKIKNSLNNNLD